jgi:hypothetical protein
MEPLYCRRCKRSFGGEQAYRRGHRRQGRPKKQTCRRVTELRRSDVMWQDDEGVWRMRGPSTPGQLKLPLFGRGRPRKPIAIFSSRTRDGRTYVARYSVRRSPFVEAEAA